jgi:CMP-N-acetylneuraminic acid synthetase
MNILVTICARGGSKGVPNKNIKKIGGIPLISYSINSANQFAEFGSKNGLNIDIALSTDSIEIKNIAKELGLENNYYRPQELATDTASKIVAINHVLEYYETLYTKKYDYVLDLDVSSPLRRLNDLQEAFNLLEKDTKAINIFSVSQSHKNPYFNMVEKKEDGYYRLIKDTHSSINNRQAVPLVYDMNASFYFYKKDFFKKKYISAITDKSLIYLVDHICFDIDTIEDFEYMEYLIVNRKIRFE